jgi:DNA polymerase II small subunit
MRQEVLDAAARRNVFLSPDALEVILSDREPLALTNTVISALSSSAMFVTKDDIMDCLAGDKPVFQCEKPITPKNKKCSEIRIIPETDVTGQSLCEGTIEDFTRYFQNRFSTLKRIIERRRDFGVAVPIARAKHLNRESKIIGIVSERNVTKNGHVMINLEDDSGTWKVLIQKDSPLIGEVIVNDSVIGIAGKPSSKGDLFIADQIYHPDVPTTNKWEPSDSTARIAFLSDVHIGSHTFLESNWKRMIKWLKENSDDMNLQYIVLPGDVVDGIGVFPDQDKELDVLDIYDQYNLLSEYLKDVPDHIKMVIHPGNHDAARPAEPQPALNDVFTKTFDSNIIMTGNPVYLEVEGRKVLSYHGKSIDDWIAGVQKLTYEDPLAVMREMMINRHIAPIYGQRTALAPEKKDYMAIDIVPDIFVSGHVHGAGTMEYHGIKMINASTWQSQTDYQKSHNFNPDPGIMPIVHLGTGRIDMKSFM